MELAPAGLADQVQIPLHLAPLALGGVAHQTVGTGKGPVVDAPALLEQGFVLAVGHDGLVQLLCQLHGPAHHALGLDAFAVVGEAGHIRGHGGHVRQRLPGLAAGDGAVGVDMDPGIPANNVQLSIQMFPAVGYGF